MKLTKALLAASLALGAAAPALAAGRGYEAPYGMAGCGLGSILANELEWNNDIMQIFATTTNGTFYSQTFGISTGTSNCTTGGNEALRASEREVFVSANLAQLKLDAARGDGPYLEAFADILGCRESDADYAAFVRSGRASHAALFSTEEPKAVADRYVGMIQADDALRSRCVRAG